MGLYFELIGAALSQVIYKLRRGAFSNCSDWTKVAIDVGANEELVVVDGVSITLRLVPTDLDLRACLNNRN